MSISLYLSVSVSLSLSLFLLFSLLFPFFFQKEDLLPEILQIMIELLFN